MQDIENYTQSIYGMTREELLKDLRKNPFCYGREDVLNLIHSGVTSEDELISLGLASRRSLENMRAMPAPCTQNPERCLYSATGMTDVFLFGIPSSGKTCVLTGLLNSSLWSVDYTTGSGNYINYLTVASRCGQLPASTNSGFSTLMTAKAIEYQGQSVLTHNINVLELPGEDFLSKIVLNPDCKVSFSDMDAQAAELFSNSNRKAVFFVIDPSSDGLIDVDIPAGKGRVITQTVAQDLVLKKMISIILKNADAAPYISSIGFIMTKADTLGPRKDRMTRAKEICMKYYKNSIEDLTLFCLKNKINYREHSELSGHPELFTFSLGNFYPGGVYDYDSTDSDTLIKHLINITEG